MPGKRLLASLVLSLLLWACASDARPQEDPYVEVLFLNVGQGDAVLIGAPEGESTGVVVDEKAGKAIISDDPALMAKTMVEMATSKDVFDEYAKNSLKAAPSYSRQRQAELYIESLERAIAPKR